MTDQQQGERWIIAEARRIAEDTKWDAENTFRGETAADALDEIRKLGENVVQLAELLAQLADYVESKQ